LTQAEALFYNASGGAMADYKITVGNCEIIPLTDLTMQFPWSVFFPSLKEEDYEAYRELYPACYGDQKYVTDAGAYAVRSGGKTVLVDTGLGPGPHAWLGGTAGRLVEDMRAKGVPPESVDIVIHTHLHGDHVGWNLTDGRPTFPNATYYAPQADMEYFEANLASNQQMQLVLPLKEMGKLQTFSGETSLAQGVTTVPTFGHTPGHVSVLVSSGGEKAMIMGDVAHHPMQVDRPDWSPGFDVDGVKAAETRAKVTERLENEGIIAAYCHFPGDGFGRIVRENGRRLFRAL
jgi:glyoxylase-like metal-dependent hydrolase (beta-lactamase superfamily II)